VSGFLAASAVKAPFATTGSAHHPGDTR
jgi:hypothetical protein